MCSDTRGASPVSACTCAASAIFSNGLRGTPGVENTLNRVPELPYAQLGTSMREVIQAAQGLRVSGHGVIPRVVGSGYRVPP